MEGFEDLELKQRSARITEKMAEFLPRDFPRAADILRHSLHPEEEADLSGATVTAEGIRGWAVMPMSQYVAERGQGHFDLSMTLLREMTKRFSSEFAIRFFLLAQPERALAMLKTWMVDSNYHVRRLVSEGTRPRLPWAMRLPQFIRDPSPVLPLLEALRDDESEYVRRSVANNLNDIAKDHPDLVANLAADWLREASPRRWKLVRHALRTLIKQGHPAALRAVGCGPPRLTVAEFAILTPEVRFGEALQFSAGLVAEGDGPQSLIVDYVVHHRKANGSTSPKVFKWKSLTLQQGERLDGIRRHPIRPITTRKYYPGTHRAELVVNGVTLAGGDFTLIME